MSTGNPSNKAQQNSFAQLPEIVSYFGWPLGGLLLIASLGCLLLAWLIPVSTVSIDAGHIMHDSGYAFRTQPPFRIWLPLFVPADGFNGSASNLTLTENGVALGPAHVSHDEIRSLGEGRFSHWRGTLWFSASDNSDPRTNNRSYEARAQPQLVPAISYLIVALDIAFMALWRRRIAQAMLPLLPRVFPWAALTVMLISILLAAGAFGTISEQPNAAPKDAALALDVIRHALIGIGVTVAQWLMGIGIAQQLLGTRASYAATFLLGFPLSLAMSALLIAVALGVPFGGWIALGIWMASLLPLPLWWSANSSELKSVIRALPLVCLLAMVFGCWTAFHWHGPTATLSGSPAGDLSWYSSLIWSLAAFPTGCPNLGNEGEVSTTCYFNMLPSGMGAALLHVLNLDDFLFMTASVGTMGILGLALALHAYRMQRADVGPNSIAALTLLLALLGAGYQPFWLVGSPPVIHTVPLTIAVWFWAKRSSAEPRAAVASLGTAFVGSALSKVVTLVTLGPVALAAVIPIIGRLGRVTKMVLAVLVGASGIYAVWMIWELLPFFLGIASPMPESLEWLFQYHTPFTAAWPVLARDLGMLLLMALAFRVTALPIAIALTAGLIAALMYPFLLRVNYICAMIILALIGVDEPIRFERMRWHAMTAFGLFVPAMILTDYAGLATGILWLLVIASLWGVIFAPSSANDTVDRSMNKIRFWLGPAVSVALVALLVATARGTLIPATLSHAQGELTPAVRDIWAAVREKTPRDALIFTDQTGREPTLLGGWNTYAFHGQRQVYVANIYASRELRGDLALADARLKNNEDVLSGRVAPTQVSTKGKYGAFYTVVRSEHPMAAEWRLIYSNRSYSLYRWEETRS